MFFLTTHIVWTYQIVIGKVLDITRGDAKILEGLGRLVDDLVVELPLDLVGRHHGPPDRLVHNPGHGLQDRLGDIDVPPLLEDFAVDHLGDLLGGVVRGSVELICLRRRRVVKEDGLESLTDIIDLSTV